MRCKTITITCALLLAGCNQLTDGVKQTGEVSKRIIADTKKSWTDLFTYSPPRDPQLPQTRYCYNTLTDVVCYDSVQNTTSPLRGYQDGDNISWVQPGGGSLGVSGGEPTAPANATHAQVAPRMGMNTARSEIAVTSNMSSPDSVDTSVPPPVELPVAAIAPAVKSGPFYSKESPYTK